MSALTRMRRGLVFLLILAAAPVAAQGTVEGHLELDGERVPITHIYAREGVPSAASSEPGHVIILMTDRPAPPEVRASREAYYAATREGRIRGALLVLEPEPRFALFARGGYYASTRVPDTFEELTLSGLRREGGTVSGRLQRSEPGELLFGSGDGPTTYRVDLSFSAPIEPASRPAATLTGAAARSSPQAAAVTRALAAIHAGNVTEARAAFHPDHPAQDALRGEEAEEILARTSASLPPPATYLQLIREIRVYEDNAVIVAVDRGIDISFTVLRDGDEWKLDRVPIPND